LGIREKRLRRGDKEKRRKKNIEENVEKNIWRRKEQRTVFLHSSFFLSTLIYLI